MKPKIETESADEIIRELAHKKLDRWQASLALRFIRGDTTGLFPLKFYPVRLQDFVRAHATSQ
jgi:hypothetical protein